MRLKFWAFIYRLTGYFHQSVSLIFWQEVQWRDVQTSLEDQEELSLENLLGIKEGMWQASHGFTSLWLYGKPWYKKLYLRIKHAITG